jgi:hypothetical protein
MYTHKLTLNQCLLKIANNGWKKRWSILVNDDDLRQCTICDESVESGFIDDDGVCDECNEAWSARHEVTEQQEWHDFDPDC